MSHEPTRTIQDAFFTFIDADGKRVWGQRAETHDIPEGEDLERGDADGLHPQRRRASCTSGDLHSIDQDDLQWDKDEWERWVDAGKINEILGHLNQLSAQERQRAATAVLQAEQGRGDKARPELLRLLAQFADYIPEYSDPDTSSDSDLSTLDTMTLLPGCG